jgi:hypothetical protein
MGSISREKGTRRRIVGEMTLAERAEFFGFAIEQAEEFLAVTENGEGALPIRMSEAAFQSLLTEAERVSAIHSRAVELMEQGCKQIALTRLDTRSWLAKHLYESNERLTEVDLLEVHRTSRTQHKEALRKMVQYGAARLGDEGVVTLTKKGRAEHEEDMRRVQEFAKEITGIFDFNLSMV